MNIQDVNKSDFSQEKINGQNTFLDDFALGYVAGVGAFGINLGVTAGTTSLLEYFKITLDEQNNTQFKDFIDSISNLFLRITLKVLFVFFVCILGPIIEEWAFREKLYDFQKQKVFAEQTMIHKCSLIITNGLIFGAAHLRLMQGWANLCLFSANACVGMIFAALRERQKDWRASAIAHSAHNTTILLLLS